MAKESISQSELHHRLVAAGHEHLFKLNQSNHARGMIADGDISFRELHQAIGIHQCDTIESVSASSSVELTPSLNIVVLFEGSVRFSIGAKNYHMSAGPDKSCVFANLIVSNDIFTRHLTPGQRVKKLTLSVPQAWLLSRSKDANDPLYEVLKGGNQVFQIKDCDSILHSAWQLFCMGQNATCLANQLEREILSLRLLNQAIICLVNEAGEVAEAQASDEVSDIKHALKLRAQVEMLAAQDPSLAYIAGKLNVSPSTLQRKFKSAFEVTVQEHIRGRRLEQARKSLLLEGLSIGEVAYNAGYKHSANFVTAFKKQFNLTPSQLRRRHIK